MYALTKIIGLQMQSNRLKILIPWIVKRGERFTKTVYMTLISSKVKINEVEANKKIAK